MHLKDTNQFQSICDKYFFRFDFMEC